MSEKSIAFTYFDLYKVSKMTINFDLPKVAI